MADLETLRRHEAALVTVAHTTAYKIAAGYDSLLWAERRDAIDWSLARVREAIAKAEVCPHCINGRLGKYPCQHCKGTGKR